MTKLTGEAVATHQNSTLPSNTPNYAAVHLSIEETNAAALAAESMLTGFNAADSNYAALEAAKSESLTRNLADLNLSDSARAQHFEDGMREFRSSAVKQFDKLALEHFRKANELLDAVRDTEACNTGPIVLAGRYAIGTSNDKYREAWARCEGVQPVELRNICVVALKTRSPDLCAAVVRRLGQMNKGERTAVGITHHELAEAGFGEQFKAMQQGLAVVKERALEVRNRYRSRVMGGSGQLDGTQKISADLARRRAGIASAAKKDEAAPERPKSISEMNAELFASGGHLAIIDKYVK